MQGGKSLIYNKNLNSFLMILLGCVLGGAAYPLFLVPSEIAPGGLTGIATIFHFLFGLPVGTTSLVMNLPLFILSWRTMGRRFFFLSLGATLLFSLCIDILPLPRVSDDMLLNAVFGGVLLGLGLGLILRGGATTGGTDMIARMIHRRFSFISVGMLLFLIDCLVILAAGFTMSANVALYSLICIYVSDRALDLVVTGMDSSKACFIITAEPDGIKEQILNGMERGVTGWQVVGEYSGRQKRLLLCVVSSRETVALKRIVKAEDPSAFVFTCDTHEALGEGFTEL